MDYLVVSDDRTFLVSKHDGNMTPGEDGFGLYYSDMRHLSEFQLLINGLPPALLSFSDEDVYQASILLGNQPIDGDEGSSIAGHSIGLRRERVVAGAVYERLRFTNYNPAPVTIEVTLQLGADFADVFLVRGFPAFERGILDQPRQTVDDLLLAYHGKDGVTRETTVRWSQPPAEARTEGDAGDAGDASHAERLPAPARARLRWNLAVAARATYELELTLTPSATGSLLPVTPGDNFASAAARQRASYDQWAAEATSVTTDNPAFNQLLARSLIDLRALVGNYPTGRLPHAGVPWYAVPFGRDSLITSLQTLCFQPELAIGSLRFMAQYQGTKDDPWRDESPGKIMHELRAGEFAGMHVVPHDPYYGTIDATLLYLMLFALTIRWTGDRELYQELLPAVRRALAWCDRDGDMDSDGYVEFQPRSERGIRIQGWKDSFNSVLYPDGSLADLPIALVEVQGYLYAAKTWIAATMRQMGDADEAAGLDAEAARLQEQFNRDFWMDEHGFYAQALDGHKAPVDELTSNPGHALIGGIIPPERARLVAERFLQPDLLSGWGIRTRASSDPNYNPMSYHNGSVWPHDNSLIIFGLQQSGQREACNIVAGQIFDAAQQFPRTRLPELMCGFGRDDAAAERPAEYPVSCSPQSWAAGTPYLMLQSILGLEPDALHQILRIDPVLPAWLGRIEVKNLRVGQSRIHLTVTEHGVNVSDSGGIEIRAAK